MFDHLHRQIIACAIQESPKEMCGYIVQDEHSTFFYQAENVIPHNPKWNSSPTEAFAIDIQERAHVESLGEILAVVHSHTQANDCNGKLEFSSIDKAACNRGDIPWLLVTLPDQQIQVLQPNPNEIVPLLGRTFHAGIFDCYSLVRDAIAEAGVKLRDYPRTIAGEWEDPNWDMYSENFEREGFVEVDRFGEIRKYDLLLMRYASRRNVINHAAIVMDVERNIFYHHCVNRLSEAVVFSLNDGSAWDKAIVKTIRHRTLERGNSFSSPLRYNQSK